MSSQRTVVTLSAEGTARLNAIQSHARSMVFGAAPSNADLVAQALRALCHELGIPDPARVTNDADTET